MPACSSMSETCAPHKSGDQRLVTVRSKASGEWTGAEPGIEVEGEAEPEVNGKAEAEAELEEEEEVELEEVEVEVEVEEVEARR
jgi:hypothetical protein